MNDLNEVFAKQKIQEQNNEIDLPTYSQLVRVQDQKHFNNNNKKNSNDNDGLVNYIGNLNKNVPVNSVAECAPVPINQSKYNPKKSYLNNNINNKMESIKEESNSFNALQSIKDSKNKESLIQLNIYNNYNISEEEKNKKKLYVNKSSYNPNNQEDSEDENPYRDF